MYDADVTLQRPMFTKSLLSNSSIRHNNNRVEPSGSIATELIGYFLSHKEGSPATHLGGLVRISRIPLEFVINKVALGQVFFLTLPSPFSDF
jgi:hypothetical protein